MRRAAALPGTPTFMLAVIAGALLLIASSSPGGGPEWLFLSAFGAGLFSVAWWAARVALMIVARFVYPATQPLTRRGWIGLFAAPILGIVAITLSIIDLPLHARWLLSRPAIETLAVQSRASAQPINVHARIGLYYVDKAVASSDNEVEIISDSFGVFVRTGRFVHSPDHPVVPGRGRNVVIPLGDHWYATIAD